MHRINLNKWKIFIRANNPLLRTEKCVECVIADRQPMWYSRTLRIDVDAHKPSKNQVLSTILWNMCLEKSKTLNYKISKLYTK